MKLSTFKQHLNNLNAVNFIQPNGIYVPRHFHLTEAGLITKYFIDCGGTVRLLRIIELTQKLFGNEDLEIEVEYQSDTIGKYGLDFQDENFLLTAKQTDCLAKDNCGIPKELQFTELETSQGCCTPGGGCC